MLQEIHLKNLALIENLNLEFSQGFSVLTGETGAGKSILLDGLGLVLGERADISLIRHGEDKAEASATFDLTNLPAVEAWLEDKSLDEDGLCLVRRVLSSDGRSRAYINERPVTLSSLKELGNQLVDIHGQHAHQSLLSTANQLNLLDAYSQNSEQLTKVNKAYQNWNKLNNQLEELQNNQAEYQSKIELLEFQLNEFNKLTPLPAEFAELSEEQNQLANANEIKTTGFSSFEFLDAEGTAISLIQKSINELEDLANYTTQLNPQLEQLKASLIDIQEAAKDIERFSENIELDPARLSEVDQRLAELLALAKKYHIDPEDLPNKQTQLEDELASLTSDFGSLEELESKVKQAEETYLTEAKKLTANRQKSAQKFSKTIVENIQTLGMEKGEFVIEISSNEKPSAQGLDKVEFMVNLNPGQALKPLAKVASGGELSRISLAIQVASAQVAQIPTLIFDEVDVGIGGSIAEVVGQKMRELGQNRQIFSITHLGQVAAYGQNHLQVAKATQDKKTTTQVTPLNKEERVQEIARMIGGLTINEATLEHARTLLNF